MLLHLCKCEMCDNQYSFDPLERGYNHHAPESWLILFQAKDMQAQEGWHFCSKRCLHNWIDSQRTSNTVTAHIRKGEK